MTKPKRVTVVGGGPAGMQAAVTAATRGHHVILFERDDRLGGQLNLSAMAPGREELGTLVQSLCAQLTNQKVEVNLRQEASPAAILAIDPDAVVIATGAKPIVPALAGVDGQHVAQAWDVLAGKVDVGEKVIVLGGGAVGCAVALYVAQMGTIDAATLRFLVQSRAEAWDTLEELVNKGLKEITVVEMLPKLGRDIGFTTRWSVLQDLARCGVRTMVNAEAREITPQGVVVVIEGEERLIQGDTVVLATGVSSNNALHQELDSRVGELHLVGDAKSPRKAYDAIREGFEVGMSI